MIIYETIAIFGYLTFGSNVSRCFICTIVLLIVSPVTGWRKHYCNVPFHLAVHCSWATGHRPPYCIFLSPAGAAMSQLFRQDIPRRTPD